MILFSAAAQVFWLRIIGIGSDMHLKTLFRAEITSMPTVFCSGFSCSGFYLSTYFLASYWLFIIYIIIVKSGTGMHEAFETEKV